MKKTRKLIPAIAMLLVSAVLMGTSSYAWFSMGSQVNASGMQVKATAPSSLIIAYNTMPQVGTHNQSVTVNDTNNTTLEPMTYDTSDNTYKYLADASNVDALLGTSSAALTAVSSGSGTYYKDYVFYIASAGAALDSTVINSQTLKATVTFTGISADNDKDTRGAISADFYLADTAATSANVSWPASTARDGQTDITVLTAELGTPPAIAATTAGSTASEAICVVMRVYFDGALTYNDNGTDRAYVRSAAVDTADVSIEVKFELATPTLVSP